MSFSPSGRRQEPLHVIPMAMALVLAAFAGAGFGLVWHAIDFGGSDEQPAPASDSAAQTAVSQAPQTPG